LLTLDYPHYEVIVADDSTDETTQILRMRWASHPKVKLSHRENRSGFKGGALNQALEQTDSRAQFIAVFDADFIPPPDILYQFLAYFYGLNGNSGGGNDRDRLIDSRLAAVQGYQWHVLNASENWITKGIRAEFSGSYVVERSSQELGGAMKMIAGSVFMIRADVIREYGWGTSITEDWELTLKLYLDGFKVLYSPFVQTPAECVADFNQLTKQRMRWAEGHTYNVKKYFSRVLTSSKMSLREKLEFLYYVPYYLQSFFFIIGTAAWLVSEILLKSHLPFWSAVLGWSLVFTNAAALVLVNLTGLFVERGLSRSWSGLLSFALLTFMLAPYQAFAALKGLLEPHEGGWHRTQKTGVITEMVGRLDFGRRLKRLLPKKKAEAQRHARAATIARMAERLPEPLRELSWLMKRLPSPARRVLRGIRLSTGWVSTLVTGLVGLAILLSSLPAEGAARDVYNMGRGRTEISSVFLILALFIPYMMVVAWRRRRIAMQLIKLLLVLMISISLLAQRVDIAEAAPDYFYLRTASLNDGREMTRGTAGSSIFERQA
jgi:glycosyltransferase involved in cell wall biosynthesis